MYEPSEGRALEQPPEPESLALEAPELASHLAPDASPAANDADVSEQPAFRDFWVQNSLLVLPIALGVMLGVFAAVIAFAP